ncbi:hypothetical protein TTHERM_00328470 (macronuclear) [Tetrahymena thermophila SB210]|uniref:Uncharacterized protein n=1 Tax=Tetrahymena thermophila (strain SB210) TaxID=312017 RepID=I7MAW3_TETTS|nr:hypothetical protein TTHERM_00328470 [Tetrahymena thermophila SB210]EAS06266.1 hypothetical protein TTHERM_00328470 [Tetrahymena thermophila SB210]|eukprot:XP_001026511.1 hypothetical protein TTHERM_00328470 [Tetrahymena thermophila SB210]
MNSGEIFYSDAKLVTSQDIFQENLVIREPEYFLNITNDIQEQQFQFANQQTLNEVYQSQKHEQSYPANNLRSLNTFNNEYYYYLNQENSYTQQQADSLNFQIKFEEPKYVDCSVSQLEQNYMQPTFSLNQIKEQESMMYQDENKKYKNQNILKDIFNSFHKYVKDLKYFPVCDIQNVDLKEIKKKFNRFVKIHSFNNSIIKYVLNHKFYKILFTEYYEQGYLLQWVSKSRVSNKDGLKYWANYLIECIKNPSHLEHLPVNRIQKNKNKNTKN